MSGDEDILGKADALMRRHRSFVASTDAGSDDIPLLTDEVRLDEETQASMDDATVERRVRDILDRIEPELQRLVEDWLATELPRIVARELGALGPRILQAANESVQDVLLPELVRRLRTPADAADDGQAR